jgi:hypothetical protein
MHQNLMGNNDDDDDDEEPMSYNNEQEHMLIAQLTNLRRRRLMKGGPTQDQSQQYLNFNYHAQSIKNQLNISGDRYLSL